MGEILYLNDFRPRESVLVIPENGDPSYEIPMPVVDAYFVSIKGYSHEGDGGPDMYPPADCPA